MNVEFDSMSLSDFRKKLIESKEILRYLNDKYHMDRCEEEPIFEEGYEYLVKAVKFVYDLEQFLNEYGECEPCQEDNIFN